MSCLNKTKDKMLFSKYVYLNVKSAMCGKGFNQTGFLFRRNICF